MKRGIKWLGKYEVVSLTAYKGRRCEKPVTLPVQTVDWVRENVRLYRGSGNPSDPAVYVFPWCSRTSNGKDRPAANGYATTNVLAYLLPMLTGLEGGSYISEDECAYLLDALGIRPFVERPPGTSIGQTRPTLKRRIIVTRLGPTIPGDKLP